VKTITSVERGQAAKPSEQGSAARELGAGGKTQDAPKELAVHLGGGVKMDFVLIPAGEFMMGDESGDTNAKPVHKVKITKPFYLGKYEVTVGQFRQFADETKHANTQWRDAFPGQTDEHPVANVSWDDANEFLKWLSGKEGKVCRLPTEAEWEYACRAGTQTKYSFGDDEKDLGDYAWYEKNADGGTHPVGRKKANRWGLYDMHGNALEWCQDWLDIEYYGKSPVDDPNCASNTVDNRVLRGGSWNRGAVFVGSAFREYMHPVNRVRDVGFRVARVP